MLTPKEREHPDFKEYMKGFNQGYLLADHMPNVAQALAETKSHAPWLSGIRDGREQYNAEQLKNIRPKWLDPDHSSKKDFDAAKGADRTLKANPNLPKDTGSRDDR